MVNGSTDDSAAPLPMDSLPARPEPEHQLTTRQRKVLQVIRESVRLRGYPPSMREIGEAVGLASTASVSYQLSTLQAKGYLRRDAGHSRTVEVNVPDRGRGLPGKGAEAPPGDRTPAPGTVHVPLLGDVAAGVPILSGEQVLPADSAEEAFVLPRQLVGDGELFMLRVSGDSMTGAGITDGDLVVVRQQKDAENGDIVAALIDGLEVEGTVKTLRRSAGHTWLMPQNAAYQPIQGDEATILGKVVSVLRRL